MRYGIIGNCKSAALIHESGSIDWCCLPNFDSPSLFARLLDPDGGHFAVRSAGTAVTRQSYLPLTNILQTEFDDGTNAFVCLDFMPRHRDGSAYRYAPEIYRILKPLRGHPIVQIDFRPRLNYARGVTHVEHYGEALIAAHEVEEVFFYSSLPLAAVLAGEPIPLEQEHACILSYHEKIAAPSLAEVHRLFDRTKEYWETWSAHCRLPTLVPEAVLRSALTLKLLTYQDTGAIIAAPTTSLPEIVGEERNWDYRYCWLRDASLLLEALKSIGHFEEAQAFIHFLLRLLESQQTKVQIVYGIDGRTQLEEETLPHLHGYRGSQPVRIGNNACFTRQNDIFGEVINTLYLYYCHYQFEPMPDEVWSLVKFLVSTIAREWSTEDAGIWEYRHRTAHFTVSKVLAWVALDRGSAIARRLNRARMADQWAAIAQAIRRDIETHGWRDDLQSFTQIYGGEAVDISLLLMQRYGFCAAEDPRWVGTVRRCAQELLRGDYVFRYTNTDDFGTPRNPFIVATLWLAKALCSIGETAQTQLLFERVLAHANHVGLLSEVLDAQSGELLGNFPQAYSHIAVINTANLLSKIPLRGAAEKTLPLP